MMTDPLALALEPDVIAARRGDRDAFGRLVDVSRNVVCTITLAILHDVGQSEDIAQDVFVAAWNDLGKLQSAASFLPWLRQLTRNRAHEAIRTNVRYRKRHAGWSDEALAVVDPVNDPTSRLIDREEEAALAAALEALPDETREVVTLYYREGRSAKQVGGLLGLSEVAVKKRLERARETLRAGTLERLGDVAQKSAPGAAFTAAVVAAIVIASPGTAMAAGAAGAGAGLGKAGVGPLAKLLALGGGAFLGIGSAFAATLFGLHLHLKRARDDEERRSLKRFAAVNIGVLAFATAGSIHAERTWSGPLPVALPWLLFMSCSVTSYLLWLPRIVTRRLEAERREDPAAEARHRQARRRAIIGTVVGLIAGLAGLLAGLAHR